MILVKQLNSRKAWKDDTIMDITSNKELQNKLEKVTNLWLECSFSDEYDAVTDVMRV